MKQGKNGTKQRMLENKKEELEKEVWERTAELREEKKIDKKKEIMVSFTTLEKTYEGVFIFWNGANVIIYDPAFPNVEIPIKVKSIRKWKRL